MKILKLLLILSSFAFSLSYNEGKWTDVDRYQMEHEADTTAFFNCLSDGAYGPMLAKRKALLGKKGPLKSEIASARNERINIDNDSTISDDDREDMVEANGNREASSVAKAKKNKKDFILNEKAISAAIMVIPYRHNVGCPNGDSVCKAKIVQCKSTLREYTDDMSSTVNKKGCSGTGCSEDSLEDADGAGGDGVSSDDPDGIEGDGKGGCKGGGCSCSSCKSCTGSTCSGSSCTGCGETGKGGCSGATCGGAKAGTCSGINCINNACSGGGCSGGASCAGGGSCSGGSSCTGGGCTGGASCTGGSTCSGGAGCSGASTGASGSKTNCVDPRNGDFNPAYGQAVCSGNGYFWCSITRACTNQPVNINQCRSYQ